MKGRDEARGKAGRYAINDPPRDGESKRAAVGGQRYAPQHHIRHAVAIAVGRKVGGAGMTDVEDIQVSGGKVPT